jgi:protein O-GlcNAc transferase
MRRTVFLSSTGRDLYEYREAVIAHLARLDHFQCDAMEHFGARDAGSVAFCSERVRNADIYVGLIGLYRGWEPGEDNPNKRSITEMEYDWACDAPAKPRLLYIAPDDFVAPDATSKKGEAKRQAAFRKRLMSMHVVDLKSFKSPDALAAAVVRGLTNHVLGELLRERAQGEQATENTRSDPFTAAAAAVEQIAEEENIDPAVLAQQGVDVSEIEAKLKKRAEAHETKGREENRLSARYYRQIGALAFLHDTDKALHAYAKATELDPDDPDGSNQLGRLQFRIGEFDAAIASFERVLDLGTHAADQAVIAKATSNLGLIYKTRGDLDQAEAMHRKSLAINEQLGHKEGMADQYGNLGLVYQARGDFDQAEAMHRKSLAIEEQLGRKEGMAADYGNLGLVYQARGDLDQAEAMHRKSLAIEEQLGRKEGIAAQYGNLGLAYQERGDLDQAEVMHRKSLAIEEQLGRKEGMAIQYGNLGLIYATRGDLDQAEVMHRKSLVLNEQLGRKEGMANQYGNLGLIYETRGDMALACAHWRKARDLFAQIGAKPMVEKHETWLRDANCPAA